MKKIYSKAVVVAILSLLLWPVVPTFSEEQQQDGIIVQSAGVQTVAITATDNKFSPSTFTVPPGQKIKVTLTNNGKKKHNIAFVLHNKEIVKLPNDIGPGETGSLEFTSSGPGSYSYYCPVDLHRELGMKGTMVVKETGK